MAKDFADERLSQFFTEKNITHVLSQILLILLFWCILWGIFGEDATPMSGYLFQLMFVFICTYIAGEMMSLIGLPPVLGMIVTACVMGNVWQFNIYNKLSSILTQVAVVIILLMAGLELNAEKVKHLIGLCLRLSFFPCFAETTAIAVSSYILLDFPLQWAFLLGFVLSATSPAIVITGILPLRRQGYGIDKEIPTLLMAASCIDNVFAITGIVFCVRLIYPNDMPLILIIMKAPLEQLIGVMCGLMFGFILWYIPSDTLDVISKIERFLLIVMSCLAVKFSSNALDVETAGPLSCLMVAFIAAFEWRHKGLNRQMKVLLKLFWTAFLPLLFGVIGCDIKLSFNLYTLKAITCLIIGLIVKFFTIFAVIFGHNLNNKEKVFVALPWLSKGSVQASFSPLALSYAKKFNMTSSYGHNVTQDSIAAETVANIGQLSIILTAPLITMLMTILGPKLLKKTDISQIPMRTRQMMSLETHKEISK